MDALQPIKKPMGPRSVTLWAAGLLLVANGILCAFGMITEGNLVTEFARAAADGVGPSVQIGTGASILGIRRRLS
jgi:hypothetical protein